MFRRYGNSPWRETLHRKLICRYAIQFMDDIQSLRMRILHVDQTLFLPYTNLKKDYFRVYRELSVEINAVEVNN